MKHTQEEKEAYRIEQERIRTFWNNFDAFMNEQGWTKHHLWMRGNQWTKNDDTIIYDRNGWQLNGTQITQGDLFENLQYDEK